MSGIGLQKEIHRPKQVSLFNSTSCVFIALSNYLYLIGRKSCVLNIYNNRKAYVTAHL